LVAGQHDVQNNGQDGTHPDKEKPGAKGRRRRRRGKIEAAFAK
jgi:hypothetical protein